MSLPSSLAPKARASFATSSRLLSCLVTESLLTAYFVPTTSTSARISTFSQQLTGIAIILTFTARNERSTIPHPVVAAVPEDVFAIIPLRHIPIFKPGSTTEIGLLDPLDMFPKVYELAATTQQELPSQNGHGCSDMHDAALEEHILDALLRVITIPPRHGFATALVNSEGPLHLWKKFADDYGICEDLQETVAEELHSSVTWQQYSYENIPHKAPTFESSSIEWEQCIIEGHPTHPMHKARCAIDPIPTINPGDYDWQRPLLRIVAVPRSSVSLQGPWKDLVQPVYTAATAKKAGSSEKPADVDIPEDHVLIPVHALQVVNVREKFPEAQILPEEYHVEASAQQSLRSVILPLSVLRSTHLKLAFGIRLTSAIRTISPPSAYLGPRFSSQIVPRLTYDRSLLIVQRELASAYSTNPDPEIAKHLAGIIREAYENTCEVEHGERAIVCTALVELGFSEEEVPLVQMTFGLDTEAKRIAWLDKFVDLFFKAFLPPAIANGVAFEAHPQNTLARFDVQTRELKGFVIRDFGGLRIHPPSLIASTGLKTLDDIIAPGHSIVADTLEDVYTRLYHTLFHNHLQQLIRVLGLHYSGIGWGIVRKHLHAQIPHGHALRRLWLDPETQTLPGKCFMRMRLQGMYRTHLHAPFPNLIHYQGAKIEQDK